MAIILGIDPGSRKLGYGIIKSEGQKLYHYEHGILNIPIVAMPKRLKYIYTQLTSIINKYKPDYLSIEECFVHKNVSVALKLGQARGAAIVAAVNADLEVFEYSPRSIKQAVVGTGGADKNQVQQMVKILLNLPKLPDSDAADALAAAICFSNNNNVGLNQTAVSNKSHKYSRGRFR